MWIVEGYESGEHEEFRTKREAKAWLKQVKAFDKRRGIEDDWRIYKIEMEGER